MKQLLIIDLQKEFKDNNGRYEDCLDFVRYHSWEYDNIVATIFKQDVKENSNYINHLHWNGCKNISPDSSLEFFENESISIFEKSSYGTTKPELLFEDFNKNDEIDIIGCDLDSCVMAICFQLWDAGFTNFKVLTRYCYTTAKDIDEEAIIKILKRNFGDCIVYYDRVLKHLEKDPATCTEKEQNSERE